MIYSDTLMETEARGKREIVSKLQSGVQSGFEPTNSAPESVLLATLRCLGNTVAPIG